MAPITKIGLAERGLWPCMGHTLCDSTWAVGIGQWALGSGHWAVGSGQWAVGSGQWALGSGQWALGGWAVKIFEH